MKFYSHSEMAKFLSFGFSYDRKKPLLENVFLAKEDGRSKKGWQLSKRVLFGV